MAETNGKPVTIPAQAAREPYRPTASTQEVHNTIARSLSDVVLASVREADKFVSLFDFYDKNETLAIRYGHLVDAAECLEIALTHLGQLKAAMSYRLLIEDEQNGPIPF
jgi:Ca2+-binding EF-hand superfamily protein